MTSIDDRVLWYQPTLLTYDPYAIDCLVMAVIARHVRDLRVASQRVAAVEWVECEARYWLRIVGVQPCLFYARVERELETEPVDYGARRRGK